MRVPRRDDRDGVLPVASLFNRFAVDSIDWCAPLVIDTARIGETFKREQRAAK